MSGDLREMIMTTEQELAEAKAEHRLPIPQPLVDVGARAILKQQGTSEDLVPSAFYSAQCDAKAVLEAVGFGHALYWVQRLLGLYIRHRKEQGWDTEVMWASGVTGRVRELLKKWGVEI